MSGFGRPWQQHLNVCKLCRRRVDVAHAAALGFSLAGMIDARHQRERQQARAQVYSKAAWELSWFR